VLVLCVCVCEAVPRAHSLSQSYDDIDEINEIDEIDTFPIQRYSRGTGSFSRNFPEVSLESMPALASDADSVREAFDENKLPSGRTRASTF